MKIKPLIFILLSSLPLYAHAISKRDLAIINKKVNEFKSILFTSDIVKLVENLPPKVREQTAKFYGYSDIDLRQSIQDTQQWYKNTNKLKTFDCNVNLRVEGKTKSRNYIVFPCTATGLVKNYPFITVGHLLAFTENHQWQIYWVKNRDDWQIAKNAYPDLENISIPNNFKVESK